MRQAAIATAFALLWSSGPALVRAVRIACGLG